MIRLPPVDTSTFTCALAAAPAAAYVLTLVYTYYAFVVVALLQLLCDHVGSVNT